VGGYSRTAMAKGQSRCGTSGGESAMVFVESDIESAATAIAGSCPAKQHETTDERAGGKRRPPTPASGGRKKRGRAQGGKVTSQTQKERDEEKGKAAEEHEEQKEREFASEADQHAMDKLIAPQEVTTKGSLAHFTATGVEIAAAQRRAIKALGAIFTNEWMPPVSHLIADTFRRTTKMMCAICCGARVVVPAYLDACTKAGKLVDDAQFLLRDEVCEAAFARKHHLPDDFSVSAALERRNQHGPLLHGFSVYCFPSVVERHDLPHIVAAAGGAWLDELPASFPGHVDSVLLLAERAARNDAEQEQRTKANRVYDVEMLREAAITQMLRRRQWRVK